MVSLEPLDDADAELLRRLIREHEAKTVSAHARNILVRWDEYLPLFRRIVPHGSPAQLDVTREKYLESTQAETEIVVLERRTA
jgi:glutamate synthase domain-containing protein 3